MAQASHVLDRILVLEMVRVTEVAAPVVLNYWRSSHYGGANVTVAEGEAWRKLIGPFLLYINEGDDAIGLWHDARQRAATESEKWPYAWVDAQRRQLCWAHLLRDFTKITERSGVSGDSGVGYSCQSGAPALICAGSGVSGRTPM